MGQLKIADIPVVIFAGGRGTRLSEMTGEIPKPMVPIGEYPILLHIMRYYSSFGFRRFVVCLGYLGHVIKEYFLQIDRNTASLLIRNNSALFSEAVVSGWEINLVETGANTLTATRLARVAAYIDTPHFCLTYGDGVTDLPIDRVLDYHLGHGRVGTVTAVHPPARFGNLAINKKGMVSSFVEKVPLQHDFINGGYFVFRREFLDRVHADQNESLEKRPLEELADSRQLYAYQHTGFWQCMDTMRDVENLRSIYDQGRAPWVRSAPKRE